MPEIRPMRDLRDTNAISRLCHATSEPVYITKNGYQDLVIMSNEEFEAAALGRKSTPNFWRRKAMWPAGSCWTPMMYSPQ